jgi:uncharacterized protein YkwD
VIVIAGCVPWNSMPAPPGLGAERSETVNRHNTKRAKHGRPALTKAKSANPHAQYVANRIAYQSGGGCLLTHSSGHELLSWYNAKAGENIGCIPGCIDAKTAVRAFWKSSPHRAIMLDGDFRRIGVGIQCVGHLSYFAVHFAA